MSEFAKIQEFGLNCFLNLLDSGILKPRWPWLMRVCVWGWGVSQSSRRVDMAWHWQFFPGLYPWVWPAVSSSNPVFTGHGTFSCTRSCPSPSPGKVVRHWESQHQKIIAEISGINKVSRKSESVKEWLIHLNPLHQPVSCPSTAANTDKDQSWSLPSRLLLASSCLRCVGTM